MISPFPVVPICLVTVQHLRWAMFSVLTTSIVSTIADNTNLCARSKQASVGWSTSAQELWLFIPVRIFMGIVVLPSLHMYWADRWRQLYVTTAFTRTRFKELLRYFHIAPPTPPDVRHTVIEKIAPLYNHCQSVFPSYFIPPREFAVDETMVGFKGRSSWKTVIKGKPTPIGYKVYTVASQGYLPNFDIYKVKVVIPQQRELSITLSSIWSQDGLVSIVFSSLIICTVLQHSVVISIPLASTLVVLFVLTAEVYPLISSR